MRRLIGSAGLTLIAVGLVLGGLLQAGAVAPANEHFQRTWARTDQPVLTGQVSRTWMWAPDAFTAELQEPYTDSPGGQRVVQYFDKARMEITQPAADPNSIWYVTNGLLVVELITGNLQTGDASFEQHNPAQVNVAGDADDPTGPTYATFGALLGSPALPSNQAITQRVDRSGNVSNDAALASYSIQTALVDDVTGHAIASPFWSFMTSSGTVWDGAAYVTAPLFENAYFATGRPITEAYWARVKVAGTYQDVLMQCFERRCLTYNPANAPEWRVEAGNVGRHYYAWRYEQPGGEPTATATQTATATTSASPSPSESPSPSASPSASPTEPPDTATEYQSVARWGGPREEFTYVSPNAVTVDSGGHVWVTDTYRPRVIKLSADGLFLETFGSLGSGEGQFTEPTGLAFDSIGNIYVADTGNHRIQKFNASGQYITQWGMMGTADGQFNRPTCVVIRDDIVYVCDSLNHRIQRFSLAGVFMDKWGTMGNGQGQFNEPRSLAFDGDGNAYVTDSSNSRVQKFDSLRNYAGLVGVDGQGASLLIGPIGIAVDDDGVVYVTDSLNRIARFAADGTILPEWGKPGIGIGDLNLPWGLAIGLDGRVYVAEFGNQRLQVFSPEGVGMFAVWNSWYGRIGLPGDIAFADPWVFVVDNDDELAGIHYYRNDGSQFPILPFEAFIDVPGDPIQEVTGFVVAPDGTRYMVDSRNDRVIRLGSDWAYDDAFGSPGSDPGQLSGPTSVAVDAEGRMYVVDSGNDRIQVFDVDGDNEGTWGAIGTDPGQFDEPTDIVIANESAYITDTGNHRVQRFSLAGEFLGTWGGIGSSEGQFDGPTGIAVDADGFVYVLDSGNGRIQKFTADGGFITAWGSAGSGPGQLDDPWGILVDSNGNVYVTEQGNFRVQVFEPVE
jgi:DNA-binding beta-propeller fold protein YncE